MVRALHADTKLYGGMMFFHSMTSFLLHSFSCPLIDALPFFPPFSLTDQGLHFPFLPRALNWMLNTLLFFNKVRETIFEELI